MTQNRDIDKDIISSEDNGFLEGQQPASQSTYQRRKRYNNTDENQNGSQTEQKRYSASTRNYSKPRVQQREQQHEPQEQEWQYGNQQGQQQQTNQPHENQHTHNPRQQNNSQYNNQHSQYSSHQSSSVNNVTQQNNPHHTAQQAERSEGNLEDQGVYQEQEEQITFSLSDIKRKNYEELVELGESLFIDNACSINRSDLVFMILRRLSEKGGVMVCSGTLEITQEGYGFLRSSHQNYAAHSDDVYVNPNYINRFGLRNGDYISGFVRAPKRMERYFTLTRINSVNECTVSEIRHRPHFDDLTPLFPNQKINLELEDPIKKDLSSRVIDIVSPLGKGQRALIVAPPRTGKTMLMQNIANSITANHPEVILIVLLIDERPEEVTDMARSVKGEVVSSTFDEPSTRHVQLAEMVIEKAKRMVEQKKDVVILLDSITRLARAYNNVVPSSGKVLSGGVDSNALQRPKRLFGAARNIEKGGSLTIIATALVETGSRMDDVIFEEFKGTGNSEIVLDRRISDKRTYPAIDISKSGTRKEDLLLEKSVLGKTWVLRRILSPMGAVDSIEFLIEKLKACKTNAEFFEHMHNYNGTQGGSYTA